MSWRRDFRRKLHGKCNYTVMFTDRQQRLLSWPNRSLLYLGVRTLSV